MAKCKGCGRRGLFLRLQNNLCENCLDRLFPNGVGAFGMTKDMFLHPDKYFVEEKPLERGTANEVPNKITLSDGSKMPMEEVPTEYDLSGIKIIDSNCYEIISEENINRAKGDILRLNPLLDKAKHICNTLPSYRFKTGLLNFKFDPWASTRNYCTLSFSALTKTGKMPRHPVHLYIAQNENLHGEIFYGQNGNIDRAEIIMLTIVSYNSPTEIIQKCDAYSIVLASMDHQLEIKYIYRHIDGIKKKIYDAKLS